MALHSHPNRAQSAQASAHSLTLPMNFKRAMVCRKCELSGVGFKFEIAKPCLFRSSLSRIQ